MRTNKGFTLIELLVVISIIALLIGILLPALGAARATARRMQSNTQIRGIHQAMVMFAQSNRSNFPGIGGDGQIVDADIEDQDFNSEVNGAHPAHRFAVLLNGNFFTPEYVISPSDTGKEDHPGGGENMETTNTAGEILYYSYAMLQIGDGNADLTPGQRAREWSETLNTEAIVLGDRAEDDDGIKSVHTRGGSNDWRGGLASNDNSVSFETDHIQRARYGNGQIDRFHMFANEDGEDDDVAANNGGWLVYSSHSDEWDDN